MPVAPTTRETSAALPRGSRKHAHFHEMPVTHAGKRPRGRHVEGFTRRRSGKSEVALRSRRGAQYSRVSRSIRTTRAGSPAAAHSSRPMNFPDIHRFPSRSRLPSGIGAATRRERWVLPSCPGLSIKARGTTLCRLSALCWSAVASRGCVEIAIESSSFHDPSGKSLMQILELSLIWRSIEYEWCC